jgi:hypothetical protein
MQRGSKVTLTLRRVLGHWCAPLILPLIAVGVVVAVLASTSQRTAGTRSSDWQEVSRGEFLRAVRHMPTGRCFVRYVEGGLIETGPDVCRPRTRE